MSTWSVHQFDAYYAATAADPTAPRMRHALDELESLTRQITGPSWLRSDGSWYDIHYDETPAGGWGSVGSHAAPDRDGQGVQHAGPGPLSRRHAARADQCRACVHEDVLRRDHHPHRQLVVLDHRHFRSTSGRRSCSCRAKSIRRFTTIWCAPCSCASATRPPRAASSAPFRSVRIWSGRPSPISASDC